MSLRVPIDALETAKYFVKKVPVDQVGEKIIRRALSRIWMAAPFSWTIGSGTSFSLAPGVASYDLAYPTDWAYAVRSDLITSSAGNLTQRQLEIVSHVESDDGYKGQPSRIYYSGPQGLVTLARVSPNPVAFDGDPRITSLYKRSCPVYSGRDIYELAVPFPDDWYWVFEEIVLYEAYKYADDNRAGEAQVRADSVSFSGQLAVFQAALGEMRLREPLVILSDSPRQKDPSK